MKLYNYFRSSASYRVRIALGLKGLDYEYLPVHLSRGGGEQFAPDFRALNPLSTVPLLEDGSLRVAQSLAIIEYLEETHPLPALLPKGPAERARARSLALTVACEVHPLNNLRVLNYLKRELGATEEATKRWYQTWVSCGLQALELELVGRAPGSPFCQGDAPGLADCFLVPQLFNARRFGCDLSAYPTLLAIEHRCSELTAFRDAAPGRQPDAEAP